MDGVPTLVSPSLTNTSPINDNYCVGSTSIQVPQVQLDPKVVQTRVLSKTVFPVFSKTLKLDVSYVADHAQTVPLHGLPQKKGYIPFSH